MHIHKQPSSRYRTTLYEKVPVEIGNHQEELEVGSSEVSLAVKISKRIIVNNEESNGRPRSKMEEYGHPVGGRTKRNGDVQ